MGEEVRCTVRHGGKAFTAQAVLETDEILVRGALRLKIPFASITSARAKNGALHVKTKQGATVFQIGPKAGIWRNKIAHPKSLIEKLGTKQGHAAAIIGAFSPEFLHDLRQAGVVVGDRKISPGTNWIFLLARARPDLERVRPVAKAMSGATALWIVYPKGQTSLRESDVRGAGLKAGLIDVKVTKFSETQTALKFVIPLGKR